MIDKMRGASVENIGVLFKKVNPDFDYMEERSVRKKHIYDYLKVHGIPKKDGLDELFAWLKEKNYKLALGSSSIKEQVMMYLDKTDYTGKFDYICAGDMIKNGKPAPDIYLHCAEKLGLKPEECIVVEDSPNGIRAGFAAGCTVFGIKDMSELSEVRDMLAEEPETLTDVIRIMGETL
jgi:beta-phosphoglucomutase-like phosphatase (HAD superfamily)